ncbi:hypothetical protein KEM48_000337 [Puccinia striiformis f. sp. tritici PST-130]|nr:hypothetical protein KEM48_000337 [Puccinia striiformis f. sp. tritici PST-130]
MNENKDPLEIDLPDSDYKSVKEDITSPEDSNNLLIEQYLTEVAKRKQKEQQENNKMSNNNPQEGSQVNNNNNSPMTTAKEYYWMAATVQLEVVAAAPQHMCPGESHFQEFSEAIWEEGVNQTLKGVFNTDVLSFSLDDNSNLPGKDKAKSVVTLLQTTISKDLQTIVGGLLISIPHQESICQYGRNTVQLDEYFHRAQTTQSLN